MEDKCGIYGIINKENNKIYIGKSKNVKRRFSEHRLALRSNIHYNNYLQKSWNKYGEDNFKFEILCECEEDCLSELEIQYMNKYNSTKRNFGYNLTASEQKGVSFSDELLEHMRTSRNSLPIIQLDMEGNYIKDWYGARHASKVGGFLQQSIRTCLNKKASHHNKYIWIYKDEYENFNVDEHFKSFKRPMYRKLVQLDNDFNIVQIFESTREASKETGINLDSISMCCRHLCTNAGGYRWEYYHNYITENINKNKEHKVKVVKLSKEGNFIELFDSAQQACESVGRKNAGHIVSCCKGKLKQAYGFLWLYLEDYRREYGEID